MTDQPATGQPATGRPPAAGRRPGPPPCPDPAGCAHVYHCPTCAAGSSHPGDAAGDYCGACGFQTPAAAAIAGQDRR